MLQRLGNVIHWTTSGAAVLSVLLGVYTAVDLTQASSSDWIDWVVPIVFCSVIGGLIWLAGKAARYVLAG
jgi:hypothetical protein